MTTGQQESGAMSDTERRLMQRVRELEAAQARQAAPPATGVAALLQLLNGILDMFPRWLKIAAGAVAVLFIAFSAYNQARRMSAETAMIEAESRGKTTPLPANFHSKDYSAPPPDVPSTGTPIAPPRNIKEMLRRHSSSVDAQHTP